MRIIASGLVLAAALAAAGGGANAQEISPQSTPQVPEGYVLIQEDVLAAFVSAPGEYLHRARDSYISKDIKSSSEEIRRCAWLLKLVAGSATESGRKALLASAGDLERLAADVENGKVKSLPQLDESFATAEYALARHHYLKAEQEGGKLTARLGRDLDAAVKHLEEAISWSGKKLEAAPRGLVDDAKSLAGRLIQGTTGTAEKVSEKIASLGKEIERLGSELAPGKKETGAAGEKTPAPSGV